MLYSLGYAAAQVYRQATRGRYLAALGYAASIVLIVAMFALGLWAALSPS